MDTLDMLASGLAADDAGVSRLFDRMAAHSESEALRQALAVVGIRRDDQSQRVRLLGAVLNPHLQVRHREARDLVGTRC